METTTQKQTITLLPLHKRNHEMAINQYAEYIKKLKNLAKVYDLNLQGKSQNGIVMAEIAVKAHDLRLKILVQEKMLIEHTSHYNDTTLPQYHLDVQLMEKYLPEVKAKVEALVVLKSSPVALTEKEAKAVKLYEDYKSFIPKQQEDEEIKMVYFKEIKKYL